MANTENKKSGPSGTEIVDKIYEIDFHVIDVNGKITENKKISVTADNEESAFKAAVQEMNKSGVPGYQYAGNFRIKSEECNKAE